MQKPQDFPAAFFFSVSAHKEEEYLLPEALLFASANKAANEGK